MHLWADRSANRSGLAQDPPIGGSAIQGDDLHTNSRPAPALAPIPRPLKHPTDLVRFVPVPISCGLVMAPLAAVCQ